MNCEFYSVFLWKVVHTDINNMDHFCMKTKSSKHKRNNQLLYPDHLKYHNVNLIVIYKFFNLLSILYEIICHIRYLVWEKFASLYDFWQQSCFTAKYFFSNIQFYRIFGPFGRTVSIWWQYMKYDAEDSRQVTDYVLSLGLVHIKEHVWTVETCPTTILLPDCRIVWGTIRQMQKHCVFPQVVTLKQKYGYICYVICMLPLGVDLGGGGSF